MLKQTLIGVGLITIALVQSGVAQAPDTLWTRYYGSPGEDWAGCVHQINDGGFIIAGSVNPYGPDSCPDLYLIKTDSAGIGAWDRTYGGSLWECGRHVIQTPDGGFIAIGETESYGGGEMEYPDIYLVKTDPAGDEEWYRTFGGPGMDIGYWVERTADGGYIIAGELDNCSDLVLIKTDTSGNEVWTRTFGAGCSVGFCVHQTPDLGYIVAGVDFIIQEPYFGGYLLKTDSLGYEQWSRNFDDEDANVIYCAQQTADSGYILTGTVGNGDNFDIFLKKVTSSGADIWTRYFGIAHWDQAFCVQPTADGGYILAGSNDYRVVGYSDGYILKTDSTGETQWDLTLGGDYSDIARYVEQTADGGYIACGFSVRPGNPADQDIWLIRLSAQGTPVAEHPLTPNSLALYQAYPNPFNSSTSISYDLLASSRVKVTIYNALGQPVTTIFEGWQTVGSHKVNWDASDQASGVYFCRLQVDERVETRKLTLVR